jgi:segregation and condensation protein B
MSERKMKKYNKNQQVTDESSEVVEGAEVVEVVADAEVVDAAEIAEEAAAAEAAETLEAAEAAAAAEEDGEALYEVDEVEVVEEVAIDAAAEVADAVDVVDASAASDESEPADTEHSAEAMADVEAAGESESLEGATLGIDLIKRVLETALLTSPEPLSLNEMKRMFPRGETNNELVRKLLDEIRVSWEGRGVELVNVASGWRFRSRPELQRFLDKLNPQKAPKYSRAVMETLAIIAYRQPVTRGDIEDIRGVVVTSNIMKSLEARGWIDVIGHREVPGRPAIYATTKQFLDDLSLRSLEELPPLDDLGALIDSSGAAQLEMNMPAHDAEQSTEHGHETHVSLGEGLMDDEDLDDDLDDSIVVNVAPDTETPPPSQLH